MVQGSSSKPSRSPFRQPWWKWNLITLAVVLFVAMWVRELARLPPAPTFTVVGILFALWWVVPAALLGELPWPFPATISVKVVRGDRTAGPSRRRRGGWCRLAAMALFVAGLVWAGVGLVNFGPRLFWSPRPWMWTWAIVYGVYPVLLHFAAAVAVWTLGDLSEAAHRLLERRAPSVQVRRKVYSSRPTGKVDRYD